MSSLQDWFVRFMEFPFVQIEYSISSAFTPNLWNNKVIYQTCSLQEVQIQSICILNWAEVASLRGKQQVISAKKVLPFSPQFCSVKANLCLTWIVLVLRRSWKTSMRRVILARCLVCLLMITPCLRIRLYSLASSSLRVLTHWTLGQTSIVTNYNSGGRGKVETFYIPGKGS